MQTFDCRFDSAVQSVVRARETIKGFAEGCGFSSSDVFDIIVAVGEACTNAVEHGHVVDGYFMVGCQCENDWLKVTVRDNGNTGRRERILPKKDRVGGLGIFLIREFTDEVTSETDSEGTSVSFLKRKSESKVA